VKRSSAAGEQESALAASISVGIGWSKISLKNSGLRTISFWNSLGSVSCSEFREYQIRASLMKLNRARGRPLRTPRNPSARAFAETR
jgi:hypothetical protein